ncbi:hypothetical protein DTO166G4_3072 [Paecilomyces variotii]|nr:hypothetical protein DTO164E3_6802 [Paecilomyces variotii]KAJ9215418.1 hypothetical protein DTO166G4_3072 [Paecilomyces variotii]KAJ9225354.1 hypothetical protein DTO169C6_2384 [Paecilomyces variotii]KAJ9233399.1 hypothetical protein DTO166G5_5757 [Paecilomyces variotii]KAJ9249760.1 hypothetical protein DTO207G8_6547 [Paecilomyces variotii]
MASTQGVNVLRYSALVAGLIYGFSHQSSLNSQAKHAEIEREYKRKESLIQQAKAEFAKKHAPADKKSEGPVTNPDDPRFDLEALLKSVEATN